MGAWDVTTPEDTVLANTLATQIQSVKTDIIERLQCTNEDAVDEHDVYGVDVTGRHAMSQVGFVKVHATYPLLETFDDTYTPGTGTLHYSQDTSTLYVKNAGEFQALSTTDHGSLIGLDTLADHAQYLATDGSRTMLGDLTLSGLLTVAELGTEDSSPLGSDHADESWYDAHGEDAITTAHFADGTQANITTTSTRAHIEYDDPLLAVVHRYHVLLTGYETAPRARCSGSFTGGTLGFKYIAGSGTYPIFEVAVALFSSGSSHYYATVINEESVEI
jgi:hypothetical protein